MKYLVSLVRILVGALFIFSGFVKAVDPIGTGYKMTEYFEEFKMLFMVPFVDAFSIIMIVIEIVLGVALLIGWRRKLTLWLLFLMMVFFTFLTGYTSITGHVTDCGCFGDFLKLKPIVSFEKDLILMALLFVLIIGRKHIQPLMSSYISNTIVGIAILASFFFCLDNVLWTEPVIDFRPYKVGNHLPDLMKIKPEDMQLSVRVYTYKDTVTGEVKKMIDSSPDGGQWKTIDMHDSITRPGRTTPIISGFEITNDQGDEMTDSLLNNKDYSFMIVAWALSKTDVDAYKKLNEIAAGAQKDGHQIFLVSKDSDKFKDFSQTVGAKYPMYFLDETPAKTIVRSNPGLVLLKNGTVIAKWHKHQFPTYEQIKQQYFK